MVSAAGTIHAMLIHPQFDPVALNIGPLAVHWYGLTYLAAFALFMFLGTRRLQHTPFVNLRGASSYTAKDIEDILFLGVLGVVLGGRLGFCLFYKPSYYAAHPFEILAVWQGGMSFHGGLLGVIAAQTWYAVSRKRWYARTGPRTGRVAAAFLFGYGGLRFIAEYFREPDDYLGLLSLGLSMGQWLCLPMVLAGAAVWVWAGRRALAPEHA